MKQRGNSRYFLTIAALVFVSVQNASALYGAEERISAGGSSPLILAHFMPWYEADENKGRWGWHWTMNAFNPALESDGLQQIASKFHPVTGAYDSGDRHVLEYQLLTMKLAGIDGVIVDWYGRQQFRDYAMLHRNTQAVVEASQRLGMKVAICYEDQTIPALVEAGKIEADDRVPHARKEIAWLTQNWFGLDCYVRSEGLPVLLSFGQTGLNDSEWSQVLRSDKPSVMYFSEHFRRSAARGAFDWPVPGEGLKAVKRFNENAKGWPASIPVVYPRFVDIYQEAKLHDSYGRVEDNEGSVFRESLNAALQTKAPIIQIATWNDWGEGTIVEPSREFGTRDLEVIQKFRRATNPRIMARPDDLQLPRRLLEMRRKASTPDAQKLCGEISRVLSQGDVREARTLFETHPAKD